MSLVNERQVWTNESKKFIFHFISINFPTHKAFRNTPRFFVASGLHCISFRTKKPSQLHVYVIVMVLVYG
jgi:hypothetical protein